MKKYIPESLVALIALIFIMAALYMGRAEAHDNTLNPTFTTFAPGQVLTAAQLNANYAHVHSTYTGGISDVNISDTANIATAKLAAVDLIPKAYAKTNAVCAGAGTAGILCASQTMKGSFVANGLRSSGTTGTYQVTVSSPRAAANVIAQVTSHTSSVYCNAVTFTATNPQFLVECRTGGGTLTDAALSVTMW